MTFCLSLNAEVFKRFERSKLYFLSWYCCLIFFVPNNFSIASTSYPYPPKTLDFASRYHFLSYSNPLIDESVFYHAPFLKWFEVEVGSRLSETNSNINMWSYKVEFLWRFLQVFALDMRGDQMAGIKDETGITTGMIKLNLFWRPFSFYSLFGSFGMYQRFTNLSGTQWIPTLSGALSDHDLVADFGWVIQPSAVYALIVKVSTFDRLAIFNLNNPYVQTALSWKLPTTNWVVSLYTRYQILLGFGRLDDFMIGINARYSFTGILFE